MREAFFPKEKQATDPGPDEEKDNRGCGRAGEDRQRRVSPAPTPRPAETSRRPRGDWLAAEPALQVLRQGQSRGVARAQALSPGTSGRSSPGRGPPGDRRRWAARAARPHLLERLQHRLAAERRSAGQQGVQDGAQAVDVGRRRDRLLLPAACSGAMYGGVPRIAPDCGQLVRRPRPAWPGRSRSRAAGPRRRAGCSRASGRGAGCPAGGRGARPRATVAIRLAAARGRRDTGRAAGQAAALDQLHAEVAGGRRARPPRRSARCSGGRGWRRPRPRGGTAAVVVVGQRPDPRSILRATGRFRLRCRGR